MASRNEVVTRTQEWLAGEPERLGVECRSPSEVVDFFCAVVASLDDNDREKVVTRAVIVESVAAWKAMRDAPNPVVLIVEPSVQLKSEEISRAVRNGHHVLVAIEPGTRTARGDIELARASQFELTKALESCGYTPVESEQAARAAAGSLAILKRRLARYSTSYAPEWIDHIPPEPIRACLLVGGWNGTNAEDKKVLEQLSGLPYTQLEPVFQQLASCREPLLLHAADNWRVISKDEAWAVFGNRVSASVLACFEPLAVEILADDDPKFTLPSEERHLAAIKGHTSRYSGTIKKHVAETLALLGALGPSLPASASVDIPASVDGIVSRVLSPDATWHRWASLESRLAMLAEASPGVFLRAVNDDLAKPEPELVNLFNEEGDGLFGGCNHAGLLWALEGVAWSKRHVAEVCRCLAELDAKDPGGNWANRPRGSLGGILSSWLPYTTARIEERIKILDLLIRAQPAAAYSLLLSLLPQSMGVSFPTHKPYWRDWANNWVCGATYAETDRFVLAVAGRAIQQVGEDAARWQQLVEHVGQLPHTVYPQLLSAMGAFADSEIEETDRRTLADMLARQINRHRRHPDVEWTIPTDVLDGLDKVLDKLRPKSIVLRHAWLFEQWPDHFFTDSESIDAGEKALEEARVDALREIIDELGFAGIEELASHVEFPHVVGAIVAAATEDRCLDELIPAELDADDTDRMLAQGFIAGRFYPGNWDWADATLAKCVTDQSKANFLTVLPFCSDTWRRATAEGQDVERLYWSWCRATGYRIDESQIEEAVNRLVAHARPGPAIDLLSQALHGKKELPSELLLVPLESLLTLPPDELSRQLHSDSSHHICDVIDSLQDATDVETERLAGIEWQYLKLLNHRHGHTPRTLHNSLATSPAFFVELLTFCFRSRNEEETPREPNEQDAFIAQQAFHLLHDWHTVPGTIDDGTVDEAALRSWCAEVRRLAEDCGRLEVCDSHIGQNLAHAPSDEDGSWPCVAVRKVIEEIATESLASGMHCGVKNSRGVVSRGRGGDQERELVSKYRQFAEQVRFDSPFVARILEDLADSYEHEARNWDERERWEE